MLLLGPGGAGKSTLFKQIKLRYAKGFTEDELEKGATTIRMSLLLSLRMLIRHDAKVSGVLKWLAGQESAGKEGEFISAPHGAITCFTTCATDVDQAKDMVDRLFKAVMRNNMEEAGYY